MKLRSLQCNEDSVVEGLSRTISQLVRLGLRCIVVIDPEGDSETATSRTTHSRHIAIEQANRLVSALERVVSTKATRLNDILGVKAINEELSSTVRVRGAVEVQFPQILARFLARGVIPVIPPLAYNEDTQRIEDVSADDVMLAITRELAGVRGRKSTDSEAAEAAEASGSPAHLETELSDSYLLDKVILLDPSGPMPAVKRPDKQHVFLNLEQEYEIEKKELLQGIASQSSFYNDISAQRHLQNLELLKNTLALLPPSSSALLTTPWQAATSAVQESSSDALGVQTRRPKNPLIFNLLTDKPLISSSLPAARMTKDSTTKESNVTMHPRPLGATFVKRGMPLTMIPNPEVQAWQPPQAGQHSTSLEDAQIDFPRLLTLIEDSFNRPLDVGHYLDRIKNRIAGIIVAGEYEGGAILTWEVPPGVPDDGSEDSRQRMVPYLDKFAVLKRSQGAGGVADIVFSAMVRSCFPDGVCWRSRRDNPVNKWYFERSVGTWKIPRSNWTMFWTDGGLEQESQRWRDYEAVCRTVMPSWADNIQVVD